MGRNEIISKARTLFWFICRPGLYPHLLQLLKRRLWLHNDRHKEAEAKEWSSGLAISEAEALSQLVGLSVDEYRSLEELYPREINEAQTRVSNCPILMGGSGALNLIYYLTSHHRAENVLETGVGYGWSSLALLLAQQGVTDAKLISVDMPYPKAQNESYVGCAVPESLSGSWTLLRLADRSGIPRAIRKLGQVDLCHYDSDKSYSGRKWAYPLIWKAIKRGGVFISDDIENNVAFKEFAESTGCKPVIVAAHGKRVGVLIKK